MLTRLVGEVDGTTGDAAAGGMERRIGMRGLEHVPVWQYVEMACQKRIVSIDKYMPRMRARYAREEIIAVANHDTWLIGRQLSVEQYLRDLRHARDGLDGEVAETVDGPGVLVRFNEAATIWRIGEEIKSKLSVRFYRVDTTGEEKSRSRDLVVMNVRKY